MRVQARQVSMLAAGVLSASMGAFHLFLPILFGWRNGMRAAPDSLNWALNSLNAFWSIITFIMGVLVIVLVRERWSRLAPTRAILGALACYWIMHSGYLVLYPFPLPARLEWLAPAFLVFAIAQAILHGWPALVGAPGKARRPGVTSQEQASR